MGNNSSKPGQRRNDSTPGFSRSDTQTSTKSGRSIRSYKSNKSRRSLSTGNDGSGGERAAVAAALATSLSQGNGALEASAPTSIPVSSNMGSTMAHSVGANESTDGYPFPNVPRSLQVHEAKEPILMYRDKDGNITNSLTPYSENGPSASGGTPNAASNANTAKDTPTPASASSASGTLGVPSTPGTKPGAIDMPTSLTPNINGELPFAGGLTPRTPGANQQIGGPSGLINLDDTIQLLLDAGFSGKTTRSFCLKSSEIAVICQAAREVFLSQPTLLELSPPVKVVGDVHGQYGDLLRLFNMCGFPPESNYLFLGDYVDRGKQSLETIVLLLCYKIKYPENFFILRGNHECASVTRIYGFYDECKRRSSVKTWRMFVDTFNTLPIAAVVAQKIFCVHGGLSPSLTSINDIRNIERPTDVPDYGLLNDLLWSDPTDSPNEWEDNERGVSYCYNKVAINKFLSRFGFDLVCRAHMVVEDGYEFFNDRSLVTVFSAPNYCGEFDNWGAAMSVSEELLCSFELLKPLDSAALKEEMRREKEVRKSSLATTPS